MKIGVIGLGSIGMRHAKNLLSLGHDVRGNDPLVEFSRIMWDEDAYVIASPTCLHKQHFLDVVKYTKASKPIFMEKPLSNEAFNADDFIGIDMVGYNLRFHACALKAKEWINAGRIGNPLWANFTCAQFNDKPAYLRDGVILNWSHEIDLALHLLGPGHLESSSVRIIDGYDDMADILLTHESGCRSVIHLDYVSIPEQRHFSIVGTERTIDCSLVDGLIYLRRGPRKINLTHEAWFCIDKKDPRQEFDDNYITEMKAFIDRIEGKDVPGCTGAEALEVLKICLEMRRQAGL